MKFSIIIPVYNVEKYLTKCLESVKKQSFQDYEVIIVNDGSTDKSQEIIDSYKNTIHSCKTYVKENGGLSDARNYGINVATGEYLFFLDSDDYIDANLLEEVNRVIEGENKSQIIRIPKRMVNEEGEILGKDKVNSFMNYASDEAFLAIRRNRITLETACTYFFKREFWQENQFTFSKGKLHEDLGLIPLVILSAERVSAISAPFYNYLYRANSITTNNDYEKNKKKAWDVLAHYDYLLEQLSFLMQKKQISQEAKYQYIYYITDAIFAKLNKLKGNDRKEYQDELKKRNGIHNITDKSMKSTIKKGYYYFLLRK